MKKKIYALCVGIDIYASPTVTNLAGCRNDITHFTEWLEERVDAEDFELVPPRKLFDDKATYRNIIDEFRSFLGQAGKNDVALFYYSGHGSQAVAHPVFRSSESDNLCETLVCHDSRYYDSHQNYIFDLTDKELGKLVEEVSEKAGHVLVILDCCHSGSGTRGLDEKEGVTVRRTPHDEQERQWEDFFFAEHTTPEDFKRTRASNGNHRGKGDGKVFIPQGKHVLMAACASDETAKEYTYNGKTRGAFSVALLQSLQQYKATVSYRALHHQVRNTVRKHRQVPQLESSLAGEQDEREQPFLGGAINRHNTYFVLSNDDERGWHIDAGAIHGIAVPQDNATTILAIYDLDSPHEDLRDLDKARATVRVSKVEASYSVVAFHTDEEANEATATTELAAVNEEGLRLSYKAVIVSAPLPRMAVWLEGNPSQTTAIRHALEKQSNSKASTYIRLTDNKEDAQLHLSVVEEHYRIRLQQNTRPLAFVVDTPITQQGALESVIEKLEHIALWHTTHAISNPASELVKGRDFDITLFWADENDAHAEGTPIAEDDPLYVEYAYREGAYQPRAIKIKITNTSSQTLYVALLDLTENYAVYPTLIRGVTHKLEAGAPIWANDGNPIYMLIPDELSKQSINEFRDTLKLIVCTEDFDASILQQPELGVKLEARRSLRGVSNTLENLLSRVHTRLMATSLNANNPDWTTWQTTFTTIRPLPSTPIAPDNKDVPIGAGIRVANHSKLEATLSLNSSDVAHRAVAQSIPSLLEDTKTAKLVIFNEVERSRDASAPLSVLELRNVAHAESVSAEHRLELHTNLDLAKDDYILATAYDPDLEIYIPVGIGEQSDTGARISIERLPNATTDTPTATGNEKSVRSIGSAIKIWFYKFASETLHIPSHYPMLRMLKKQDKPEYENKIEYQEDGIAAQIQHESTQRILLIVHGILGETPAIVKNFSKLETKLSKQYDAVLTFDYENLNTPLEETAQALKDRLESIGLAANHGKTLHIMAHSMGGLVSRYMIEKLGGDSIVQKLVLLGTPSGGSPWPSIAEIATGYLTLGLNGAAIITRSNFVVSMVLRALAKGSKLLHKDTEPLKQMQASSAFLEALASSSQPATRYYTIAGNKPVGSAASSLTKRIFQKLALKLSDMAFLEEPNDFAVKVTSVQGLPQEWQGNGVTQGAIVPCNHFQYFENDESVEVLAKALES